ncbi:hypothetical protein AAV96_09200 [Acinetobacter sp. AG1]|uniref:hypothetical protein n=1 Tax=Acinetobacter TaxID=469 RepID=UPI0006291BA5|nr:hypothetical protein [Acinetobacter sp. AG1]KKW79065.1 hypothetical protein AAV96_09200 [Acinetobacter sp. AG1]
MKLDSLVCHNSYYDNDGNPLDLCFDRKTIYIQGSKVILDKLPYLINPKTGDIFFPTTSKYIIEDYLKDGFEVTKINQFNKFNKKHPNFYKSNNFNYSMVEHFFIPGLIRNIPSDGFLTPVYFNPNLLVMFEHGAGYNINKYSKSYGLLSLKNGGSIKYGVNRCGFVIMWLGDLVELSADELSFFYSQMVGPKYDIHSDFYRAEILGEWI